MRDRIDEFPDNVEVVVITFSQPELVQEYVQLYSPGFPVLCDLDRSVYAQYGLGRGKKLRVWGWRAALRYLQVFWNRRSFENNLSNVEEDTLQLGGDFAIDANGSLIFGFWGEGPDDRPAIELLASKI